MVSNVNEYIGGTRMEFVRVLGEVLVEAPLYGWDGRVLVGGGSGKIYLEGFMMSQVGLVFKNSLISWENTF